MAGTTGRGVATRGDARLSTETKHAFKTTEFIAYVVAVVAVLIAGAVGDSGDSGDKAGGLGATDTWLYVTLLTIGYMISRGLAKAGSREPFWAGGSNEHRDLGDDR